MIKCTREHRCIFKILMELQGRDFVFGRGKKQGLWLKLGLGGNENGTVVSTIFIWKSRLKIVKHNVVIMGHVESCFSCISHEILHL